MSNPLKQSRPVHPWYSPTEVARLLGLSVQTIQKWIRDGQLPAARGPGEKKPHYRISPDELRKSLGLPKDQPLEAWRSVPPRAK